MKEICSTDMIQIKLKTGTLHYQRIWPGSMSDGIAYKTLHDAVKSLID